MKEVQSGTAHPKALECAKWLNADEKERFEPGSDELRVRCDDDLAAIIDERCGLTELQAEVADLESTFELRWSADMRAIKRWQEATGRHDTWPDHADLCVWLMERIAAIQAAAEPVRESLEHYGPAIFYEATRLEVIALLDAIGKPEEGK